MIEVNGLETIVNYLSGPNLMKNNEKRKKKDEEWVKIFNWRRT